METASKARIHRTIALKKNEFEKLFWSDQKTVVGIDEVGRGCLAGPLVVGAVILPIGVTSPQLKDSKVMSPAEREKAFAWITKRAAWQVAILHNRLIDQHDIYRSTLMGMKKALVNLLACQTELPGAIVVDAMPLTLAGTGLQDIPIYYFTKGENRSSSIAAASIVAKVTRDRLMERYGALLPGYGLEHHKGYATLEHRQAILAQHETIIHRTSFLRTLLTPEPTGDTVHHDEQHQQTLC